MPRCPEHALPAALGRELRIRRERQDMSLSDLAQHVRRHPDHLRKLESGLVPVSLPLFYKWCRVLGVRAHYVLRCAEVPS